MAYDHNYIDPSKPCPECGGVLDDQEYRIGQIGVHCQSCSWTSCGWREYESLRGDMIPRQQVIDELLTEYKYWRDLEDKDVSAELQIGAMGAVSNVLVRLLYGKETETTAPKPR